MSTIGKTLLASLHRFRQHIPPTTNYPGNIGVFRFVMGEIATFDLKPDDNYEFGQNSFGEGVFGASFMVYQDVRDGLRQSFTGGCTIITNAVTGTDDDDRPTDYAIYAHEIKPIAGEYAALVDESYPAANYRNYDSEYLIANYVQKEIVKRGIVTGVLHLLTERPPCTSCTGVLKQFLAKNQGVFLKVYHRKPGGQPTSNFLAAVGTARASLHVI